MGKTTKQRDPSLLEGDIERIVLGIYDEYSTLLLFPPIKYTFYNKNNPVFQIKQKMNNIDLTCISTYENKVYENFREVISSLQKNFPNLKLKRQLENLRKLEYIMKLGGSLEYEFANDAAELEISAGIFDWRDNPTIYIIKSGEIPDKGINELLKKSLSGFDFNYWINEDKNDSRWEITYTKRLIREF